MRDGLERVDLLPVGSAYVELGAGARKPWDAPLELYARAEAGAHPLSSVDLFGFLEGSTVGAEAGLGARWHFP